MAELDAMSKSRSAPGAAFNPDRSTPADDSPALERISLAPAVPRSSDAIMADFMPPAALPANLPAFPDLSREQYRALQTQEQARIRAIDPLAAGMPAPAPERTFAMPSWRELWEAYKAAPAGIKRGLANVPAALGSGTVRLESQLLAIPGTLADIYLEGTSALSQTLGAGRGTQWGDIKDSPLNPLAYSDALAQQTKAWADATSPQLPGGMQGALKTGDVPQIMEAWLYGMAENAPQLLAMAGGLKAGLTAEQVLATMAAAAGASQMQELEDKTDMSRTAKHLNAIGNGIFEYLGEKLGTIPILKGVMEEPGTKELLEKSGIRDLIRRTLGAMLREGTSELATQIGQNAVDVGTGNLQPGETAGDKMSSGLVDAFAIGAGIGAGAQVTGELRAQAGAAPRRGDPWKRLTANPERELRNLGVQSPGVIAATASGVHAAMRNDQDGLEQHRAWIMDHARTDEALRAVQVLELANLHFNHVNPAAAAPGGAANPPGTPPPSPAPAGPAASTTPNAGDQGQPQPADSKPPAPPPGSPAPSSATPAPAPVTYDALPQEAKARIAAAEQAGTLMFGGRPLPITGRDADGLELRDGTKLLLIPWAAFAPATATTGAAKPANSAAPPAAPASVPSVPGSAPSVSSVAATAADTPDPHPEELIGALPEPQREPITKLLADSATTPLAVDGRKYRAIGVTPKGVLFQPLDAEGTPAGRPELLDFESAATDPAAALASPPIAIEPDAAPMRVKSPKPGSRHKLATGHWAVVELDQLTSGPGFQDRDRSRAASGQQVQGMFQEFDPEELGPSVTAESGAITTDHKGRILAGYGRRNTIEKVYADKDRAAAYTAFLAAQSAPLGLTAQLAGKKRPVLVRVAESFENTDAAEFARESNAAKLLGYSLAEQALRDAHAVTGNNLIPLLTVPESGDLGAATNRDFQNAFMRHAGIGAEMTKADGTPVPELTARMERAVLASLVADHPRALAVMTNLAENAADPQVRRITAGLLRVAPALLKLRADHSRYDLIRVLARAIPEFVAAREQSGPDKPFKSPAAYFLQDNLFAGAPEATRDAAALLNEAHSAAEIADVIGTYITAVRQIAQATPALFAQDTVPDEQLVDIFKRSLAHVRAKAQSAATPASSVSSVSSVASSSPSAPGPHPDGPGRPAPARHEGSQPRPGQARSPEPAQAPQAAAAEPAAATVTQPPAPADSATAATPPAQPELLFSAPPDTDPHRENGQPTSWAGVQKGDRIDQVKKLIPKDHEKLPALPTRGMTDSQIIDTVQAYITANPVAIDLEGRRVLIANPEHGSLRNRAEHYCGVRSNAYGTAQRQIQTDKAATAGAIRTTIENYHIKGRQGTDILYFRRYANGQLHLVIADGRQGTDTAGQVLDHLVITQYTPEPRKQFEGARVLHRRASPAASGPAGAGDASTPQALQGQHRPGIPSSPDTKQHSTAAAPVNSQPAPSPALAVAAVASHLAPALAKLPGAKIQIVQSLPPEYVERVRARWGDQIPPGFYDPATGTSYLIADGIRDTAHAERVLLHELIGHQGIEHLLSAPLLQSLANAIRNGRLDPHLTARLAALRAAGYTDLEATKELIAATAETQGQDAPTFWHRLLAFVRTGLRRLGLVTTFTHEDLAALLTTARARLQQPASPVDAVNSKSARNQEPGGPSNQGSSRPDATPESQQTLPQDTPAPAVNATPVTASGDSSPRSPELPPAPPVAAAIPADSAPPADALLFTAPGPGFDTRTPAQQAAAQLLDQQSRDTFLRRILGNITDAGGQLFDPNAWRAGRRVGGRTYQLNRLNWSRTGTIQKAAHKVNALVKLLNRTTAKLTPDQRAQLTNLIQGQQQPGAAPDAHLPAMAPALKLLPQVRQAIDTLSAQLVAANFLSEEMNLTITENQGQYIVRGYQKFSDKNYRPTPEAAAAAAAELEAQFNAWTERAATLINRLIGRYATPERRQLLHDYLLTGNPDLLKDHTDAFKRLARRLAAIRAAALHAFNNQLTFESAPRDFTSEITAAQKELTDAQAAYDDAYRANPAMTADEGRPHRAAITRLTRRLEHLRRLREDTAIRIHIAPRELTEIIHGTLEHILISGTPRDPATQGIQAKPSPQWRIIEHSFKRRQDIPESIRAYMGEITDLAALVQTTMTRMHQVLITHEFQRQLLAAQPADIHHPARTLLPADGSPRVLTDTDGRQRHFIHRLPDAPAYGPLRGMLAEEPTFNLIKQIADPALTGAMARAYAAALALFRVSKTALNPATHFRNFLSNYLFAIADGEMLHPLSYTTGTAQAATLMLGLFRNNPAAQAQYQAHLQSGLISSPVQTSELRAIYQRIYGDNYQYTTAEHFLGKLHHALKTGYQNLTGLYALEDTFHKLAAYHSKLARGLTPESARQRVRDAFPYYDMAPEIVTGAAKVMPILEDFLTFRAESFRIAYNHWANAITDSRRGDLLPLAGTFTAHIIANGLRLGTAYGLAWAFTHALNAITGAAWAPGDDDDEDNLRALLPEYQRYNSLMIWKDDTGQLQYLDLGYLNPWDTYTKAWHLARGGVPGHGRGSVLLDISGNLIGAPMAVQTYSELLTGRELDTNRELYTSPGRFAEYATRRLAPSGAANLMRIGQIIAAGQDQPLATYDGQVDTIAGQTGAMLTPSRVRSFDPQLALEARLRELARIVQATKSEAGYANRLATPDPITGLARQSEASAERATTRAEDRLAGLLSDQLQAAFSAAEHFGLITDDLRTAAHNAGLSKADTDDLLNGLPITWEPAPPKQP